MSERSIGRRTAFAAGLVGTAAVGVQAAEAARARPHRLALHVDENDPARMNLTLNNLTNVYDYYKAKGEKVQVELVAYGPGLHIFRSDTSPAKARLDSIKLEHENVVFSACGNTIAGMQKAEGKTIALLPEVRIVPAGVVRLIELQESGWSYIRP